MFRSKKSKKELRRERMEKEMRHATNTSSKFTQGLLMLSILLLGIVIGMKVSDLMIGQKVQDLVQAEAAASEAAPAPGTYAPVMAQNVATNAPGPVTTPSITAMPDVAPVSQPAENSYGAASSAPVAATQSEGMNAAAREWQAELDALRMEQEMMEQQFNRISGSSDTATPGRVSGGTLQAAPQTFSGGAASQIVPMQEFLEEEANSLSPREQRIMKASALAKVRSYNADWRFVVIDAGRRNNITEGQVFAVRRGSEIIAEVKVETVEDNECTAELLGRARYDADRPVPQAGDDVIPADLF